MVYELDNQEQADNAFQFITSEAARGSAVEIKIVKARNKRTIRQNSALHLMFTHLAEQLNEGGLYMQKVLKPGVEIEWTPDMIKEYIWKPLQKAQTGKESTTQLERKEVDEVFNTLVKHFGEKFNLTLEFPSIETLLNK